MEEFGSQCVFDYLKNPLDLNLRNEAEKELTKVHNFLKNYKYKKAEEREPLKDAMNILLSQL